jgi:hypothetical protein
VTNHSSRSDSFKPMGDAPILRGLDYSIPVNPGPNSP